MEYGKFETRRLPIHGRPDLSYGSINPVPPKSKAAEKAGYLSEQEMADQGYRIISQKEVVLPRESGLLYNLQRLWAIPPRSNAIRTTKYTIFTFFPKNLFEQFHRFANWYFLLIIVLNFIPQIQAFGKEVSMIPLLFVLTVTAVKDAFEDLRRFRSDREVNNREVLVYDWETDMFVSRLWREVCVGDFVKLSINEVIPADILLLHSSEEDSTCYIETANIDGETNLKQRQVVQQLSDGISVMSFEEFQPSQFNGAVYCEPPHSKIYDFGGYIIYPDGKRVPVNRNHLLLRGCVLRNTQSTIGIVVYAGHETKSMLNNSGPRTKRSKLERDINVEILSSLGILFILCIIGSIGTGVWTQSRFKSFVQYLPQDDNDSVGLEAFIRFWTFLIVLQVIIPISLYITMEIVKFIQVYFINWDLDMYYAARDIPFQCRALNINEDLGQIQYVFSDKTGTLTENEMRFQCCTIAGVNYPHQLKEQLDGLEQALQSHTPMGKKAKIDIEQFCYDSDLQKRISELSADDDESCLHHFFVVLAICNTVVVSKRRKQKEEQSESTDGDCQVHHYNMENLSEAVLSEVEQLLGHTNINDIEYEAESPDEQALVEAARKYGYVLLARAPGKVILLTPRHGLVEYQVLHVLEFDSRRKCMSVIVRQKGTDQVILYTKGADSAIFSFLDHHSGLKFDDYQGVQEGEATRALLTQGQLNLYARLGLRTLCIAKRVLSQPEYTQWSTAHHDAEVSLTNRDELLFQSYLNIEKKLELLGATGIEDRLQDGVPEAIAGLRQAGIKVWVLTGDKQETAINVGYSSQLFDEVMDIIIINASSEEDCRERLEYRVKELEMQAGLESASSSTSSFDNSFILAAYTTPIVKLAKSKLKRRNKDETDLSFSGPPKALVIDGATLTFALQDSVKGLFLEVTKYCKSVICCRATPLQKAQVVQLVKEKLGAMTLGIGDGANDVSMIQMADVGVGISGREGMQAVIASDFAMGRFHFLQKLLLVHGHWCYSRLSRLVLYFFYKNVAFAVLLFWYQLINGYSGSNPVDGVNLFMFNLAYTSLPIIVVGVADQDLRAEVLMRDKSLYAQGRLSKVYTRFKFWIAMLEAFYQSLVVFLVASWAYDKDVIGLAEFGFVINISIVFTVTLHLAIETYHWTIANHIALWGSLIFTLIFNLIYCAIDTRQVFIDTYQVFQVTASRGKFWFLLLLIPAIALLPRLVMRVVRQEVFPSDVLKARAQEKLDQTSCMCLRPADEKPVDPVEPVSFSQVQTSNDVIHTNNT